MGCRRCCILIFLPALVFLLLPLLLLSLTFDFVCRRCADIVCCLCSGYFAAAAAAAAIGGGKAALLADAYIYIYIYMYIHAYMCVCACFRIVVVAASAKKPITTSVWGLCAREIRMFESSSASPTGDKQQVTAASRLEFLRFRLQDQRPCLSSES